MPEVQSSTFTEFNVRRDQGTPCFIRLHDSVVRDLERRLASGREQPGILLGTVEAGDHCTIVVEDFESNANVDERIRTWTPRAGSRQKVVGCYRSHSLPEFALDQADRALFQRCFPQDARLLLQVKTSRADVGVAMFFLGENGRLVVSQATVEFPFNLRELGAEEQLAAAVPITVAEPQLEVVETAKPAPAVVAAPQPVSVAAKTRGGMFWKLSVAAVVVIASVVGLSLRVFDGQNSRPPQPATQQPAPVEETAAVNPPAVAPNPPLPAPTPAKAAPAPKTVVAPPKKTATVLPPTPAPATQTLVTDNVIARPPARSQPVTQTPAAAPPVSEAQTRTVTAITPAPPTSSAPPANNVRPSAPPAVAPASPVRPAGPFTPPRPIRQTAPVVRDSVRRSIIGEIVIKVRANIDATGKVISAESVSPGNPVAEALAASAIAAIKNWQFEPAQRGAEKVPGDVLLSFTFRK